MIIYSIENVLKTIYFLIIRLIMAPLEEQRKQTGFIYMIKNTENNDKYIGSTFKSLDTRFEQHKLQCNNKFLKTKLYKLMRNIGKDKFYIEPLETVEVNDRRELTEIEDKYIAELGTLNHKFNNAREHKITLPTIQPEPEETQSTESEDIERKEDPCYDEVYSDFNESDFADGRTIDEEYLDDNVRLNHEVNMLKRQLLDYDIKIDTFLRFKACDNSDSEWLRMRVKIIKKMNDGVFVKDRVLDKYLIRWNSHLKHYY